MILDIITTKINLASGYVHEANGFMVNIVQNDLLFILVKAIGTIIILLILSWVITSNEKWGLRGMGVILTFYTLVFINNVYWIMRYL